MAELAGAEDAPLTALSLDEWRPFRLSARGMQGESIKTFTFELPSAEHRLGLLVGQHIAMRATIDGKEVVRYYTPVADRESKHCFQLVVKVDDKGVMSQYLDKLKPGDSIEFRGPMGDFTYRPNKYSFIGMLAGGTGIAPMIQILRYSMQHPEDKTKFCLLYGCMADSDVLFRDEMNAMAAQHADRFSVVYLLAKPPPGYTGLTGFITAEVIKNHFAAPAEHQMLLMCGPPPMMNAMLQHSLGLGYPIEVCYNFSGPWGVTVPVKPPPQASGALAALPTGGAAAATAAAPASA